MFFMYQEVALYVRMSSKCCKNISAILLEVGDPIETLITMYIYLYNFT
jgi:hypothetical protein